MLQKANRQKNMAARQIKHPETFSPRVVFRTSSICNFRCPMCAWGNPSIEKIKKNELDMPMELYSDALKNICECTNKGGLSDTGEFMAERNWKDRIKIIVEKAEENPNLMFHQITNFRARSDQILMLFL
tara:strand:- start:884 stop:1270 length:387 start_codon:yes stop_codon:yes gene_type:complete